MEALHAKLARPENNHEHSSMSVLEAFGISFIAYDGHGVRRQTSFGASRFLQSLPGGPALVSQADRIVTEELLSSPRSLECRRVLLTREVAGATKGVTLAVHLFRPDLDGISALVILRAECPSDRAVLPGLTPRETAVARLLAAGMATKEIAHRLGVSTHTARHHTERVFAKLGVRTRAAAAAVIGMQGDSSSRR